MSLLQCKAVRKEKKFSFLAALYFVSFLSPCTVGSQAMGMKTFRLLGMKTFFQELSSRCLLMVSRQLVRPQKFYIRNIWATNPGHNTKFALRCYFLDFFVTFLISLIHGSN